MTKKLFTEKEVQALSKNRYVKSVSQKGITYTDEFKRIFIEEMKKENHLVLFLKNVDLI